MHRRIDEEANATFDMINAGLDRQLAMNEEQLLRLRAAKTEANESVLQ